MQYRVRVDQAMTNKREQAFKWFDTAGRKLKFGGPPHTFMPGRTGVGRAKPDQPFPLNPTFRSQPVLSEEARETIWSRVVEKQESLKSISVSMGIDIRRVAAVVRLKEVEKRWIAEVSYRMLLLRSWWSMRKISPID
jgi:hypothetical protein